jgi:hypothetical protein
VYEATVEQVLPRFMASTGNYNANELWAASSSLELTGSLREARPKLAFLLRLHQLYSSVLESPRTAMSYRYPFSSYLPVPSQLTQKWPERCFTPDARRAQGHWPVPFMGACRRPIGSRTRADGHQRRPLQNVQGDGHNASHGAVR